MVFMPPGSGKSIYSSVLFPAWFVGLNQQKNIIAASYAQELADKFGRRVRAVVREPHWRSVFDTGLSEVSQAASRWALESGAEYYGVGVMGAVTGFRADLGLIDDPVKGRDEAESETIRNRTWDWYKSDFWTRLKPGASIILVTTRWHADDLAGRLLAYAEAGGEKWDVLSLPMLAEPGDAMGRVEGEPLWPEWFTEDMIEQAKRDSRTWSALYQQRPAPAEGGIFKSHWFRRYTQSQETYDQIVQSWDTANKASELNDPSCCTTWGIRPDGYDLLQVLVKRLEYPDLKNLVVKQAEAFGANAVLIEDKASGQQLLQDLKRSTTLPLIGIMPNKDKITRASAVSAMVEAGKVSLPTHAAWLTDYEMEMLTFPNSPHADQVDSTTQFLNWIRGQLRSATPGIRSL